MPAAGLGVHADDAGVFPEKQSAEGRGVWLAPGAKVGRWFQLAKFHRLHLLGGDGGGRRVKERCDLLVGKQTPLSSRNVKEAAPNSSKMKSRQPRLREGAKRARQLAQPIGAKIG